MGDVVIELVLQEAGVIPTGLGEQPQVIVTVFDETTLPDSLRLADEIRKAGYRAVVYPHVDKLGKQFKYADKLEIKIAIILGPDELANNQAAIKDLKSREQISVDRGDVVEHIRRLI
jgi:histidyl-tRNA synthetase